MSRIVFVAATLNWVESDQIFKTIAVTTDVRDKVPKLSQDFNLVHSLLIIIRPNKYTHIFTRVLSCIFFAYRQLQTEVTFAKETDRKNNVTPKTYY